MAKMLEAWQQSACLDRRLLYMCRTMNAMSMVASRTDFVSGGAWARMHISIERVKE